MTHAQFAACATCVSILTACQALPGAGADCRANFDGCLGAIAGVEAVDAEHFCVND